MRRFSAYGSHGNPLVSFGYVIKHAEFIDPQLPERLFVLPWRAQPHHDFTVSRFACRFAGQLSLDTVEKPCSVKRASRSDHRQRFPHTRCCTYPLTKASTLRDWRSAGVCHGGDTHDALTLLSLSLDCSPEPASFDSPGCSAAEPWVTDQKKKVVALKGRHASNALIRDRLGE